jgi:type I restriction enzyme S subunit
MQSNLNRLGDYIEQCDIRNREKKITRLRGISTSKQFIESKANMTGVDISSYKVVNTGEFAYVADTSRRGEKIALAFNDDEPCIISSIYTAFKVKDQERLLPEYLFLWFNRSEFDRYARYHSWGSARETFDWDEMCDVLLPIPSIDVQRKYVSLYNALIKNQRCYESTLDDLQLISNTFLEDQIKKGKVKKLEPYIQKSDLRNIDLSISNLRGISTSKKFIESKANMTGVSFQNYRVVNLGQFAYVADTSRRGDKIALAMSSDAPCIVSSIYTVFEVKPNSDLIPEYLYLWFSRPEFDRYARFHSWGSARETFDWSDMCNVKLPIPSIDEQKSIVAIHHTLETRKKINDKLKETIRPLCPVLMQGVIKDLKNKETQAA